MAANTIRMRASTDVIVHRDNIPKYARSQLVWAKPETRTTTQRHNGRVVRIIPNNKEVILRGR